MTTDMTKTIESYIAAYPEMDGILLLGTYCADATATILKALSDHGLAGKVKYVCFDFMDEIVDALYDGIVNATIGQDPYGQGADPVIFAYNAEITGEEAITGNEWTKMDVVTPDNVAEYYPR